MISLLWSRALLLYVWWLYWFYFHHYIAMLMAELFFIGTQLLIDEVCWIFGLWLMTVLSIIQFFIAILMAKVLFVDAHWIMKFTWHLMAIRALRMNIFLATASNLTKFESSIMCHVLGICRLFVTQVISLTHFLHFWRHANSQTDINIDKKPPYIFCQYIRITA